jgi:hypothetical protein
LTRCGTNNSIADFGFLISARTSKSRHEPKSARFTRNLKSKEERKMGRTILIVLVVAIVVGGAAAFGGYKMGDSAGFERANLVRQQFAQTRQGGQGGQGQGGAGGFAAGGAGGGNRAFELQGTVKSIDNNTMTVTVGQRDITVTLTNQTQFLKSVTGARTDLTAGARVMVAPETTGGAGAGGGGTGAGGGAGAGGSINAASVTVLPAQ